MRYALACALLVVAGAAGCLEQASRTQSIPPSGECLEAELPKGRAPGEACGVAEECAAFCCACPAAGAFEARLCLGGACVDAATTCDDARTEAEICG